MPSTLAQLEVRVSQLLFDTANAIFTTGLIDEAIRIALAEYNRIAPRNMEALVTLPGDGREVALNGVADLLAVTAVWWPYDSTDPDAWPPNVIDGWQLLWDDAQPLLYLPADTHGQPQLDDELRLWYTAPQTVQNLDSASASTLPAPDETLLVLGAAGYACISRSVDLNETTANMAISTPNYGALGAGYLSEFRRGLDKLKSARPQSGAPWPSKGWKLDKWDK